MRRSPFSPNRQMRFKTISNNCRERCLGDFPAIIHNPRAMEFSFTLPNDREFDVVGFGLNAIDHLVTIPRFPSSTPRSV